MKIRHLTAGLVVIAFTLSGGAFANEIYKWTDADGNVHYGDRPSGQANEEMLQVSYNRTDNSAVQSRVKTRQDSDAQRREARDERDRDVEDHRCVADANVYSLD